MLLYNVTVNVEASIEEDWLQWMKEEHIPMVLNTGLFSGYRFGRLLVEEEVGRTYSIQYEASDLESFRLYEQLYADELRRTTTQKYGSKIVAFRTLLDVFDQK